MSQISSANRISQPYGKVHNPTQSPMEASIFISFYFFFEIKILFLSLVSLSSLLFYPFSLFIADNRQFPRFSNLFPLSPSSQVLHLQPLFLSLSLSRNVFNVWIGLLHLMFTVFFAIPKRCFHLTSLYRILGCLQNVFFLMFFCCFFEFCFCLACQK